MLSYVPGAVLIVVLAGYGVARAWRWLARQWFPRVLWQFLSGWHPGNRPRRGRRAARRCGAAAGAVALVTAWSVNPQVTEQAIVYLSLSLCIFASWLGWQQARQWKLRRLYLRPLHKRLAPRAGVDRRRAPQAWIKDAIPGVSVRLELPAGFTAPAAEEREIERIAALALAIESPEPSWHRAGPKPQLILAAAEPPPGRVTLADVRTAIDRARADELVWGLGRKCSVVSSSLSGDSPHLGLSMGSGAGKSVTARFLLAQMLYKGCIGLILDYKMISHQWARDLPNVVIARRPHEIHAALLWLGAEAERRNEVALAGSDMDGGVHAVVGPRLIVVCEELNATMSKLRAYWRLLRNEDRSLPQRSPALEALDAVNLMGRQVLMNLLYMGQRLSVKAVGGDGDARESIGVVAFGRYSASNWKMLAPDHPMPPGSRAPGRIQVVDDRVRETQGALAAGREARALAVAGDVAALPAGMPGAPRVATETPSPVSGADMGLVSETGTVVLAPPSRVTLSEAVTEGIVSCSLHAVRKASQRDRDFPGGVDVRGLAKLYDAVALAEWDAGRR